MCPETLGVPVITTVYVYASHAAKKVTRRVHTVFIIFLNRLPIIWYSKRHNTVEASTVPTEFIWAKACEEHKTSLIFKLHMLGIPVIDPIKILCGNESLINNYSILSSILNKNHISIAYHVVRCHIAAGLVKFAWIDTSSNLVDAMTNILTSEKRGALFVQWNY